MILPPLRAMQERLGYLPKDELEAFSNEAGVPLHRINEVISFFPHFRREPPPDAEALVCRDLACHLRGAKEVFETLDAWSSGMQGRVRVKTVSCLGRCDRAPAAIVELHTVGRPERIREPAGGGSKSPLECLKEAVSAHLAGRELEPEIAECARRPWRIDPYFEASPDGPSPQSGEAAPYRAVRRYLELCAETGPAVDSAAAAANRLLSELEASGLRGMGGAGFPTFRRWADVLDARGREKFIVCNADESEPATFKDRELLLRTPDLIIEGMTLAALVTGAENGYVYIRHEYHEQIHKVNEAIIAATRIGALGENILGSGRRFEMEVFESPGGYICGEQGALIEAIEERRAEPRNKPPSLETNGLFDKPTVLNNVETFAWVPAIFLNGGAWYAGLGAKGTEWYARKNKPGAKGMRFFSICGDVKAPGVYEVAIGSTLGELIDLAGGVRAGLPLKAVAPSGPSGGFLPAVLSPADLPPEFRRAFPADRESLDVRDLPLDLDEFRSLGLMLGAGITVFADTFNINMFDHALAAARFFRNESCGKCVPCRLGSQKLVEIGERVLAGGGLKDDRATIDELLKTLEDTSICGLGMSAAKPLATAYQSFAADLRLIATRD